MTTQSPSPTTFPYPPRMRLRAPSLDNASPVDWRQHGDVAYLFARHARHDLANVHCALNLFEMVQRIRDEGSDQPLPPELSPQRMQEKINRDIKQLITISHDLVLLNQAANPSAYRQAYTEDLDVILQEAIANRLGDAAPDFSAAFAPARGKKVLALGDMLPAAISAFFFQWSPHLHDHSKAATFDIKPFDEGLVLSFPSDDEEIVSSFTRRLHSREQSPLAALEHQLTVTTAELAFWLARFIVLLHGGWVDVSPDDPNLTLQVMLPLVR